MLVLHQPATPRGPDLPRGRGAFPQALWAHLLGLPQASPLCSPESQQAAKKAGALASQALLKEGGYQARPSWREAMQGAFLAPPVPRLPLLSIGIFPVWAAIWGA